MGQGPSSPVGLAVRSLCPGNTIHGLPTVSGQRRGGTAVQKTVPRTRETPNEGTVAAVWKRLTVKR